MKYLKYSILVFVLTLFYACKDDSVAPEEFRSIDELIGEWSYVRTVSETFKFLLLDDEEGVLIINKDNKGEWLSSTGAEHYDIEWTFDEAKKEVEITRMPKIPNEFGNKLPISYMIRKISNNEYVLRYEEDEESTLQPGVVIHHFENLELRR